MVRPTAAAVTLDDGVGATVVGAGVAETADVVANASAETKDNNDVNNKTVKTGANAAVRSFQLLYHFPLVVAIVLIFLISRALDGRIPKSVVCLGTRSVQCFLFGVMDGYADAEIFVSRPSSIDRPSTKNFPWKV